MKKLIAIVVAMVMVLALCACGAVEESSIRKSQGENVGKVIEETTDTIPEDTTRETTEEVTEDTVTVIPNDPNNVFINLDNYIGKDGEVTVNPRQAMWDGEKLVLECFVINRTGKTVTAFKMENLVVSNDTQELANGYFGDIVEVEIPDGQYVVHTFNFTGEAIKGLNGDLSHLVLNFNIQYRS